MSVTVHRLRATQGGIDRGALFVYAVVAVLVLVVGGILVSVVLDAFATSWFGGWLPDGFTDRWFRAAITDFDLPQILLATAFITLAVAAIGLLVGVPAAYVLARRRFRFKGLVQILLLLPLLLPPITYGIPLATMLYEFRLAGTAAGVIVANLVPALPLVVLLLTPFFEQIDPNLERAARVLGASPLRVFTRVLVPLAAPGVLAAALIVIVRALALFELTFLTSGADSTTLVVALYYAAFAPGIRPSQQIDAMAVVYMVTSLALLLAALRFVNPTNMVVRVRR
jgi:putative spermidine/putrescine transport system permease protein